MPIQYGQLAAHNDLMYIILIEIQALGDQHVAAHYTNISFKGLNNTVSS